MKSDNANEQKRAHGYAQVTDPEPIARYDQMTLYIPQHEKPETLDIEMMTRQAYAESAKEVGHFRPIEVAICEHDPEKDSSVAHDRVHLRIINGRHRYLQDPTWPRNYYYIDNILEYFKARKTFDMQKECTAKEKEMLITEITEALLRTENIAPEDCCSEIIKRKLTHWSGNTVMNYCPSHFKHNAISEFRKTQTYENLGKETKQEKLAREISQKHISKKDKQITELNKEITDLTTQNVTLSDEKKMLEEKLKEKDDKVHFMSISPREVDVIGCEGLRVKVTLDYENDTYKVEKA